MSNRKSIVLLLLAIVAAVAANVLLRSYGRVERAQVRETLIESPESVERIAITRRSGVSVVMERRPDWRIVQPFAGAVDEREIARLLDVLSFSRIVDSVADAELLRNGRTRAEFSLADPLIRLSVSGRGRTSEVSFGVPTPSADGVYVAVEGTDAVFVVPSEVFAAVDRPADEFRRRAVFGVVPETVTAFDIKRGTGSMLSFLREGGGWTLSGARASERKVSAYLASLTGAAVVDFVWPIGVSNEVDHASASLLAGYGLDPENAVTVTLKGGGGADRRISFGKDVGGKLVYALIQNESAIVTLPAALREEALQDARLFTDARLFPVEERTVAFFSLADGETSCALARDASGAWRLESPIAAPADGAVVADVLNRILSLTSSDSDASGLSVSISTNAAEVRVSRERVLGRRSLESLRSAEILRIDPEHVKRLVRTPAPADGKPVSVIAGRERRSWNVESPDEGSSAAVSEAGVASVLSALNPLAAVRVEKLKVSAAELDAYGLGHPYLILAVDQDQEGAVRRNVLVGDRTAGGRFATVGSSDAVFVISDETVGKLSAPIIER